MDSIAHNKVDDDDDDVGQSDDEFDEYITLGKSSAFLPVKWKFPSDTVQCPLFGCELSFSNRLIALVHFRLNHASTAMLCMICDVPFASADTSELEHHNSICHPDTQLPTLKTTLEEGDFPYENYFEERDEASSWNDIVQEHIVQEDDIIDEDIVRDSPRNGEDWIDLSGCGKKSRWKFPIYLRKCPECAAEFDSRYAIIAHYKETHSADTILCYLCDWPILGTDFQMHFRLLHPNDANPFHFDDGPRFGISSPQAEGSPPQAEESQSESENRSESETEENEAPDTSDDFVELRGQNTKSFWRFPNVTSCPHQKCSRRFANRMDAKRHYVQAHARNSVLCTICDKPVVASYYEGHYKRRHTNSKPSKKCKRQRAAAISESDDDDDDDDNDADDNVIKLKGAGMITYWQLPTNLNRCPVSGCRMVLENNSALKQHYKRKHAKHSVLCEPCGYPLIARYLQNFQIHMKKTHPNISPGDFGKKIHRSEHQQNPANDSCANDDGSYDTVELSGCNIKSYWIFPRNITKCPERFCHHEFGDYAATLQHYRSVHAKNAYYCDVCVKPILAYNLTKLKTHFKERHPDIKPANIFGASSILAPSPQKKSTKADSDVDDLIALGKKCNQINYWRFPSRTTRCPSHGCSLDFCTRAAAIRHFRECHADSYILCSFCAKPIYAPSIKKMKAHFKAAHPLYPLENDTNDGNQQALSVPSEQSSNDNSSSQYVCEDDEDNDWIALKGLGHITYWRFPSTNQCPSILCSASFQTQAECKSHYKQTHAQHMLLCPNCNKPINVNEAKNFITHHRRMHSDLKMPYEFMGNGAAKVKVVNRSQRNEHKANEGENELHAKKQTQPDTDDDMIELTSCGIKSRFRFPEKRKRCLNVRCNLSFDTRAEAIRHYRAAHSNAAIYCEKCKKPVHTQYLPYWQEHCSKRHPEVQSNEAVAPKAIDANSTASKPSKLQTTKIYCPLKECSYKTRRMHKLQKHWDKVHPNLHFPVIHDRQLGDGPHDAPAASKREPTTDTDHEDNAMEIDTDGTLLVPLSELPVPSDKDEPRQQSPSAKRPKLASTAAVDPYEFDDTESEIITFRKRKSPTPHRDSVVCDGNVTSTAECSIELGNIKMEIDSPLYDGVSLELPPNVFQSPMHSGFILGEAHSMAPEDFIVNLESDDESFHSAEESTEDDKLTEETAQTITNGNASELLPPVLIESNIPNEANKNDAQMNALADPSDEMEVTTTVQDITSMTINKYF